MSPLSSNVIPVILRDIGVGGLWVCPLGAGGLGVLSTAALKSLAGFSFPYNRVVVSEDDEEHSVSHVP